MSTKSLNSGRGGLKHNLPASFPDVALNNADCLGFTLLEILVAVTVLALVAGTVALALFGPGRALEAGERQAETDREVTRTLRRLHDDLAAVPRDAAGEFSADIRRDSIQAGELYRFVSRGGVDFHAVVEHPVLVRLRYRLVPDERMPGALRLMRRQSPWAPDLAEQGEELVLCRAVRQFSCGYGDSVGTLHEQWPPGEGERQGGWTLPPAWVECRLERWLDIERGQSESFTLAVLLPTGRGSGRDAQDAGAETGQSPAGTIPTSH